MDLLLANPGPEEGLTTFGRSLMLEAEHHSERWRLQNQEQWQGDGSRISKLNRERVGKAQQRAECWGLRGLESTALWRREEEERE
jgi:hypothetical protein